MHAQTIKAGAAAFPAQPAYEVGVLAAVAHAVRGWLERQRTAAQLSALTDRELTDIGLSRADIAEVAAGRRSR